MSYYLHNGLTVTARQIRQAVIDGLAVLSHGHCDHYTASSLMLDGVHYDTRGECYSMADEVWTRIPTLRQALRAAYCRY